MVSGAKPKGVGQAAANPYLHLLQQYMEALLPRGPGGQLSLPARIWKRLLSMEVCGNALPCSQVCWGTAWLLGFAERLVCQSICA